MQNKLLFLVVIFLVITVQFISSESSNRKNSNTNKDDDQVVSLVTKKKTIRVNDQNEHPSSSSNRRDRISQHGSSSNNHRSRSRGPSSYDDEDEWSPYALSPGAYETGPYLSNGPNCYPLLDPQYPFFSDLCGAVPQARYALPNAFGHMERWQIAQVLGTVLGPMSPASANPVCTRSLRLLLCPLLFPPCPTKYEARPVVPCQPFCRVVKTQCAAPGLELLPCDLLPPSSDLCPINPTPYSSLLSSFIPPPPLAGPMFPPGLPPSALSALLAQSAMASGIPPMGMLPPTMLPPTGILPPSAGVLPPPPPVTGPAATGSASSTITPTATSAAIPPPTSILTPSPFPSVLPGVPFSPMMNSMDPSSSGLASMLAASGMSSMFPGDPSSPLASMLAQSAFGSGLPPTGFSPMLSQPPFGPGLPPTGLSPMNPLFSAQSLFGDSLSPILVDFPPLPFGAGGMSPAAPRFFPRLRSATTEEA